MNTPARQIAGKAGAKGKQPIPITSGNHEPNKQPAYLRIIND